MKLRCQGCEVAKLAFEPLTSSHKQGLIHVLHSHNW